MNKQSLPLRQTSPLRCCVVGPGRLGSTLLAALPAAGFTVSAIAVREGTERLQTKQAAAQTTRPQATKTTTKPPRLPLASAVADADLVWLTVPDDAIRSVAEDAAQALRALPPRPVSSPLYALHSSGLGNLELLAPLREAGARVLCIHPLQTFTGAAGETSIAQRGALLHDVPAAVTAADERDTAFGMALAHALGMRPFRLADEAKPLYHLAAALACNLLVALESEAGALMDEATDRQDGLAILGPLVQTTLANLRASDPAQALTGPLARGDVGTVRTHLRLLSERPAHLSAAYRSLSLAALELAAAQLDGETVRALRDLLEGDPK